MLASGQALTRYPSMCQAQYLIPLICNNDPRFPPNLNIGVEKRYGRIYIRDNKVSDNFSLTSYTLFDFIQKTNAPAFWKHEQWRKDLLESWDCNLSNMLCLTPRNWRYGSTFYYDFADRRVLECELLPNNAFKWTLTDRELTEFTVPDKEQDFTGTEKLMVHNTLRDDIQLSDRCVFNPYTCDVMKKSVKDGQVCTKRLNCTIFDKLVNYTGMIPQKTEEEYEILKRTLYDRYDVHLHDCVYLHDKFSPDSSYDSDNMYYLHLPTGKVFICEPDGRWSKVLAELSDFVY
jgi:hypothetical protein